MPYVNVRIIEDNVTVEQKLRVIERITQVMVEELNKDPAGTFVVIDEVPTDNWGHHGTSVTKLRAARAAAGKAAGKLPAPRAQKTSLKSGAAKK
jgi:4-oxalocrotonate tautomerase